MWWIIVRKTHMLVNAFLHWSLHWFEIIVHYARESYSWHSSNTRWHWMQQIFNLINKNKLRVDWRNTFFRNSLLTCRWRWCWFIIFPLPHFLVTFDSVGRENYLHQYIKCWQNCRQSINQSSTIWTTINANINCFWVWVYAWAWAVVKGWTQTES